MRYIHDLTIAQIPSGAVGFGQLLRNDKTLAVLSQQVVQLTRGCQAAMG